eukprot:508750-Pleurochrysis_carterae.AAC.1
MPLPPRDRWVVRRRGYYQSRIQVGWCIVSESCPRGGFADENFAAPQVNNSCAQSVRCMQPLTSVGPGSLTLNVQAVLQFAPSGRRRPLAQPRIVIVQGSTVYRRVWFKTSIIRSPA